MTSICHAIEPFRRASSQFKFSLAAYSYRKLLSGDSPSMTLFDFADDCARFGLHGTELTSYYFPADADSEYMYRIRRHCFLNGLDVSGTAIGNDFGHPEGEKRKAQIEHTKRWIEFAQQMGAPVIRIFAGHQQDGIDAEQTHKLVISGIEECCDYAGKHGIHLALENHGGPTATADGLLKIVRDVKSPWFGVNLDTGNFRSDSVYEDLAKAAPFALNVQVKVVVQDTKRKKSDTDFARLAKILRDASYRGYVVLEYEEGGDPRKESKTHLDQMRLKFARG